MCSEEHDPVSRLAQRPLATTPLVDQVLEAREVAAGQAEPGAVIPQYSVLTAERGAQLSDSVLGDDGRAVDTDEASRVQPRLHVRHGAADQEVAVVGHPDVRDDAAAGGDRPALELLRPRAP